MNTQPTTFEVTLPEELSGISLLDFKDVLEKQGIAWGISSAHLFSSTKKIISILNAL